MTLGYISAFSETLALSVIVAKAISPLLNTLEVEKEEHIKAAAAWALGQIGRHSPDHAKTLADKGVLPKLLSILTTGSADANEETGIGADLKTKTKRALKCILEKTLSLEALEPMLQFSTPANILKYVIGQFSKILPHDVTARREFVTSGSLQRLQEIATSFGSPVNNLNAETGEEKIAFSNLPQGLIGTKMGEYIRTINECYPEEIVRYYSPGYPSALLDKIDEYNRMEKNKAISSTASLTKSQATLIQKTQSAPKQSEQVEEPAAEGVAA